MDDVLMRIGEVAAFFGVSVKAMRIYEKLGILTPEKVDGKTGYRYYTADQVKQLDALLDLKRLGFTLSEIKALLAAGLSNDKYMQALAQKKMQWQDAIVDAQDKIDIIDGHIAALEAATPPTKAHDLTEDERARLLSRMVCVEDRHGRSVLSEALWL